MGRQLKLLVAAIMVFVLGFAAAGEPVNWLQQYAADGTEVLYVDAGYLKSKADDYAGKNVCTKICFGGISPEGDRIFAGAEDGADCDYEIVSDDIAEYLSLGENEWFSVVGYVEAESANAPGNILLADCHIVPLELIDDAVFLDGTHDILESENEKQSDYVYNKNTHKFHETWCSSVDQMKEKNKGFFTGTRDELIEEGYDPCKKCNP